MPFPRAVAKTNRYWINPVARRVAGRLPPFILIRHVGRISGRRYETPVWAFRQPAGFLIVLTYGPDTDWVRNLRAAGSCEGRYGGQTYVLDEARIVEGDPRSQPLPWLVQRAVGLIGVRHFLIPDRPRRLTGGQSISAIGRFGLTRRWRWYDSPRSNRGKTRFLVATPAHC